MTSASAAKPPVRDGTHRSVLALPRLNAFTLECAKDSTGPEEQNDEDDDERDHVLVGGRNIARAKALQQPEDEAADDRAWKTAQAAEDRGGETFQSQHDADVIGRKRDRGDQHAGHRTERRGQPETREQHLADIDADQLRGKPVVRRGENRLAQPRPPEEPRQRADDRNRDAEYPQTLRHNRRSENLDRPVARERRQGVDPLVPDKLRNATEQDR